MSKKVLSIDIGLQKTRICEVEYLKKKPRVFKCITFETPENTVEEGYILNKEELVKVTLEHLKEAGIGTREVVFTIASTKIANREVSIPLVKEKQIQSVILAGAQDYFPVNISEYTISYNIMEKIDTKEEKQLKLLLLAAPNNLIKNYYSFAEMMNFTIVAIDYIGNSLYQVTKNDIVAETSLLVQINEQNSLINVMSNKSLGLQRTIPYGVHSVIEAVMENAEYQLAATAEAEEFLMLKDFHDKEDIMESVSYLMNNITRVIDYYNSRFPDKKIQMIYLTGQGARFNQIDKIFIEETGYECSKLNNLHSVEFAKNCLTEGEEETDYMCAIGAAIQPIGFVSRELQEKEGKKSSLFSVSFVLSLSAIAAVIMIGTSLFILGNAQNTKKDLNYKIRELQSVETTYAENAKVLSQYKMVAGLYNMTVNPNEKLNDLIKQLEEKLPNTIVISSFSVTDTGISMNISTNSKLSAAKLLLQLKEIDSITNVAVEPLAESEDENGFKVVTFTVTCQYNQDIATQDLKIAESLGE